MTSEEEGSFQTILYEDVYKLSEQGTVMDHEHVEVPFPLLDGERILYIGLLCDQDKAPTLVLSNFRFFVAFTEGFYNVPLGLVDNLEVRAPSSMVLQCFNAQEYLVTFYSEYVCQMWKDRIHEVLEMGKNITELFAYKHHAVTLDKENTVAEKRREKSPGWWMDISGHRPDAHEIVSMEFNRLRMKESGQWRITECNVDYQMCSSYPKLLIVPHSVTDGELEEVAKFRVNGRIPVVVWRHDNGCVLLRSSQPKVGWFSYRNAYDEKLLLEISRSCDWHMTTSGDCSNGISRPPSIVKNGSSNHLEQTCQRRLLIFDLRAYMACLGNRAKGGGTENPDNYTNCAVQYKGLANIYDVYKSFSDLRLLLTTNPPSFLSSLENTKWLLYISQLLAVSLEVVATLDKEELPVLVHCSDGWDRTPQVVALAKIILDPHYRTIDGFRLLIEREWLSFGHQFEKRCNFAFQDKKSPIFLQWLDCVHQLLKQCPCEFEFNEDLLLFLANHCYSNLYGTFTGESEKERQDHNVYTRTKSVWSALEDNQMMFMNFMYSKSVGKKVLCVQSDVKYMVLWNRMYMQSTCNRVRAASRSSSSDPCTSMPEHIGLSDRHELASWTPQPAKQDTTTEEAPQTMEMSRMGSKNKRSKVDVIIGSLEKTDSVFMTEDHSNVRPLHVNKDYVNSIRPLLGPDGFVQIVNPVQCRLQQLLKEHKTEVTHLNKRVHELQEERRSVSEKPEEPSPTFNSWEEVNKVEEAVKWVPDHAVNSCMNCSTVFSLLRRRHHCRNCGGVFCYDCAHHFMPVESELLNKPVRVCECCFDKLDGHLRKDNNSMDSSESTNKDI